MTFMESVIQQLAPISNFLIPLLVISIVLIILKSLISKNHDGFFDLSNNWLALLVVVLTLIMLAVILSFTEKFSDFSHFKLSNSVSDWGAVGDFFGGMLNPIFAFASFIALLVTIKMQTMQMKKSDEQIRNNQKSIEKQQFESLFLELWKTMSNHQADFDKHFSIAKESPAPTDGHSDVQGGLYFNMEDNNQMLSRVFQNLLHKGVLNHPYFLKFITCIEMLNDKTKDQSAAWEFGEREIEFYLNVLMSSINQNFLQVIAFVLGHNRIDVKLNHYASYITHFNLLKFLDVKKPIFSGAINFFDVYMYHWDAYGSNMEAIRTMRENGCAERWKNPPPQDNRND